MKRPKFEVGDRINLKRRPNLEYNILTITDVDLDLECYTCNQGSVFSFDEQDDWKLVERGELNSETLGAHLRNLLTPYKTLLSLVEDVNNGKAKVEVLKKYKCNNIKDLLEFSRSEEMETGIWRK